MNIAKHLGAFARSALGKGNRELIKSVLGIRAEVVHSSDLSDIPDSELAALRALDSFTMTSLERRYALLEGIRHLDRANIEGAFVECGVWRGGSAMLMASESLRLGRVRDLYLYDTYEGMPPPEDVDVDFLGVRASDRMAATIGNADKSDFWARAQIDVVRTNLASTGYPELSLHYVQGKVEQTLPAQAPDSIALLRLDTDWYSSTRHELVHLYPRLRPGGILIIDDYGHWKGARQAVDEYFAGQTDAPLLVRVDQTCRLAVKRT